MSGGSEIFCDWRLSLFLASPGTLPWFNTVSHGYHGEQPAAAPKDDDE